MGIRESRSQLGSNKARIMFVYAMYKRFFPRLLRSIIMFVYDMYKQKIQGLLRTYIQRYSHKFTDLMYPYIHITIPEFSGGDRLKLSHAYTTILTYLSANSSQRAKRLTAEVVKDSQTPLVLSMDENEEITDEFKGVKLWWGAKYTKTPRTTQLFSLCPTTSDSDQHGMRCLTLTFHKRHRDLITGSYIRHVLKEGKAITMKNRRLKLYTNNPSKDWWSSRNTKWSHTTFEHPARFETLAMDAEKKQEIINDLVKFKTGKEYYAKIGKAWKRGYLLFGPPGTGKSTMIAAMANFMNYDVYDLELTAVKNNSELRKLLIDTSNKSIIVIEDIDCSLDLTGQRKKRMTKDEDDEDEDEDEEPKDPVKKGLLEERKESKVTLSGLLNFIDGIWSASGGERIIIFTTNYVEKLDPALIRRGRMDMHIEMSYCSYQAFKLLAKNYLGVESHSLLFPIIEKLLGETNMTPADVAENLMPKSITEDFEACFKNLIQSLETEKKKAEKEAKKKDEKMQQKAAKDKKKLAQEEVKSSGDEVKETEDFEACFKNLIQSLEEKEAKKKDEKMQQKAAKDKKMLAQEEVKSSGDEVKEKCVIHMCHPLTCIRINFSNIFESS